MRTDIPLKRLTDLCGADLLTLFGIADATVQRVDTKEQLMTSDLITYLVEEEVAEREARSRYVEDLQRTLEATIAARFPQAPLSLALTIRNITQPDMLHRLIVDVVRATDLETVEQDLNSAGIQ